MVVTYNNQQYKVTPIANGHLWRLSSVERPRESVVLNRQQMIIAGLEHAIDSGTPDFNKARAAQNKIVIARFLQDEHMWHQAIQEYHQATGRGFH
ncbi:hypothetical protein ACDI96_26435 [Citrobacter telavivensis]